MPADKTLTADDVRRIVREENMRLLRVLLAVSAAGARHGTAAVQAMHYLDHAPTDRAALSKLQLDVLNYAEGR